MLILSSSLGPDHRRALPLLSSVVLLALVSLPTAFAQQSTPHSSVSAQNKTRVSASSPFGDAEALLAQGKLDDARARTEELLNAHPTSVEGYNLLGIIEGNGKSYAAAEKAFQHALELNPSSARTRTNLGDAYAAQLKLD